MARKKFAEIPGNADVVIEKCSEAEKQNLFCDLYDRPEGFDDIAKRMKSSKYIIYGGGYWGRRVLESARFIDAIDNCVCVWDKKLSGTFIDGDVPVKTPSADNDEFNYVLLAASERSKPEVFQSMLETLYALKVPQEKILYPFSTLYNHLGQYFDKDIILPRLEDQEVFIDAGCYDFYTANRFVSLCERKNKSIAGVKKIYAFEPDTVLFDICKNNSGHLNFVVLQKCGLWSENKTLPFSEKGRVAGNSRIVVNSDFEKSIDVVALDNIIPNNEKVTFIKMDIEGAELEALKGAEGIISRDKPKLAICVYHKLLDYIDIPLWIKNIDPEYKAYMRHYQLKSDDTVLYCVK